MQYVYLSLTRHSGDVAKADSAARHRNHRNNGTTNGFRGLFADIRYHGMSN